MKVNFRRNVAVVIAATAVLTAFLVINITGIYWVGPYAWDDGAITLAYAKTLADHGTFALTSASDISEGSSSLLFVLLMSALHKLLSFRFESFILASQAVAFLATCAVMGLVYRQLAQSMPDRACRALIAGLLGTLPMFTAEIFNGMEMSLFAFLLVATAIAYQSRSAMVYWMIPLLLLVRFESVFYLLFSFSGLFALDKNQRAYLIRLACFTLLVFGCITMSRLAIFGDIIPNTIRAKMHPPYSSVSLDGAILQRILGAGEFILVHFYLLLATTALLLWQRKAGLVADFKLLLILSFGIFSLVTGKNWSYEGRMFLPCLPLFVLAMIDALLLRPVKEWLAVIVLALALIGTHYRNLALFQANFQSAINGGHYQNRLGKQLENLLQNRLQKPGLWYGVTPQNYRITGLAVEKLRILLQLPTIKFMVPDVGGLGLCCDDIRVIDSGMLTNSTLARQGYKNFNEHLQNMSPDVIETHDIWSEVSGIYQSSYFNENYTPLIFDNNLFWLRSVHTRKLATYPYVQSSQISLTVLRTSVRYADASNDYLFLQSRGLDAVPSISVEVYGNP